MSLKLAVCGESLDQIIFKKNSTLAMLLAAARRGYQLFYIGDGDLFLRDGQALATRYPLQVFDNPDRWYQLGAPEVQPLVNVSCILIRKDPPFTLEYLYMTYVLEQAEQQGVLVVNKPASLRDANEKLYLSWFPQCCPPTLVTCKIKLLREFLNEFKDIIIKPLDRMGGRGIFRISLGDLNTSVILETATVDETQTIMAQRYLPEIENGDKRILLIGGEPVPYALARIPQHGETRGNMAAGGRTEGRELTARDRYLCEAVGPYLKEKGLWFVGLDVIGDYITEINVTSPTGIRELDRYFGISIADQYLDFLEQQIEK